MKLAADLHTHTIVSDHALSTVYEMITQAKKLGMQAIAITDHGVAMPDSPHPWYFSNLIRMPSRVEEMWLIKGVEANVIDKNGKLDMADSVLKNMDWVIASIHGVCAPAMTYQETTHMWLQVAEHPWVDMIGHSEQKEFLYDYNLVTRAFAANHKVVEMNAGSSLSRPGNEENLRQLALCCKQNGTRIAVTSDAHSMYSVGNVQPVLDMLAEIEFPEERIVNTSMERLADELDRHGRPLAGLIRSGL